MVDIADFGKIAALNGELQTIIQSLDIINDDGRIINCTVASRLDDPLPLQVTVQTASMDYPPQMIAAIKDYLNARVQEISDQLTGLGVTGVDATARVAPSPKSKGASK